MATGPAFVVDSAGRVAWMGDPQDIEEPLMSVLAGKWDLAAKAALEKEAEKAAAEEERSSLAYGELDASFSRAAHQKRYDDALKIIERIEEKEKTAPQRRQWSHLDTTELHLALLSVSGKQPEKAEVLAKKLLEGFPGAYPSPAELVISAIVRPQEILDYGPPHRGYDTLDTVPRDVSSIFPEIDFSTSMHLDPALRGPPRRLRTESIPVRRRSGSRPGSNLPIAAFCWPGFTGRLARTIKRPASSKKAAARWR